MHPANPISGSGTPPKTSRRSFLTSLSSVAVIGAAGCSSKPTTTKDFMVDTLPTPTMGAEDAPVVVSGWYDYTCPHCSTWFQNLLPKLESDYIQSEEVKFQHHDYPIPHSPLSWPIANAGRAVQDTVGVDAFFEFAKEAHRSDSDSRDAYIGFADQLGADPGVVRDAMARNTYYPVLETDKELGNDKGVDGTPEIFVNGVLVEKAFDYDVISAEIDSNL